MKILAFGHRSRTGKDTSASICLRHIRLNYPDVKVETTSFAGKLKEIAYSLYGWAGVQIPMYYDQNPAERDKPIPALSEHHGRPYTVVDLWIDLGMNVRTIYGDTWVRQALHTETDVLIIPDLRFPNEIDAIRKLATKSMIIKIIKPDAPKRDSPADNALEDWNGWDQVIMNDQDLSVLYQRVVPLAEAIAS